MPEDTPTPPEKKTDASADIEATRLDSLSTETLVRSAPVEFKPPSRVGRYRILRKLGEGGMGVVFEAEQKEPVRRRVALKLIKPGMDSERVIARFDTERQALALMNHDNVARVLDAGSAEDGRPYFVMEYVAGVPITEFCDKQHLSTEDRLELFVQVCEGVHHAHQKGIIHRDLKPSNIMVELHDGRPRPKIIDFGVAKATSQRLSEQTIFTEFGALVGTPEYMSPEQAEMSELDIDTRSDVYSLGVVLYELLVGALPIESRDLRSSGYGAICQKIREEVPSVPSARLTTLGGLSGEVAANHGVDLPSLARELRGDLDWITMKALEKDRARRYSTVVELAADIRRHQRFEPVTAGPPSVAYRVRKFVRRHRVPVVAAATFVVMLMLGVSGTTVGLVQAREARDVARFEADTSRQVIEFLTQVFDKEHLTQPGETVTARAILDRGAEQVRLDLRGRPQLQGRMMETIALIYRYLGLFGESRELLHESLDSRRLHLGPGHADVASSLTAIAGLMLEQGEYDDAVPWLEEALEIQHSQLPGNHPERARVLNNLGIVAFRQKDRQACRDYWERALAIRESAFGPDSLEVAKMLGNLASVYGGLKQTDLARSSFERAIQIRERLQRSDHPDVARLLQRLAALLESENQPDEALVHARRALSIQEQVLEPGNPRIAFTSNTLGKIYLRQGRLEAAREAFEKALAIHVANEGESGRRSVQLRDSVIFTALESELYESAIPLLEAQIRIAVSRHGAEDASLIPWLRDLSGALQALGRDEEARLAEARADRLESGASDSTSRN